MCIITGDLGMEISIFIRSIYLNGVDDHKNIICKITLFILFMKYLIRCKLCTVFAVYE